MTALLKVITEYCEMYVDDIRMQELARENAPLYARKMSQYLIPAISLFTLPTEMQDYLVGTVNNPKLFEPMYENKRYTVEGEITEPFEVELGDECTNFELFSAHILAFSNNGAVVSYPTNICDYDESRGVVTINASPENPVKDNTTFDFDFYTDGAFEEDLSPQIMNILGMCFQVVWQDRFNADWLSNVSKIEDKSFTEQNRANKMNADTARLNQLRSKLAGEMRKFEQDLYYKKIVPFNEQLIF